MDISRETWKYMLTNHYVFFFDKIKLESLMVYLPEGGVTSTGFDFPPPGTKKK